jgi:xylulose-5-phosphate/fructose-6-phosphate phosphoketolase
MNSKTLTKTQTLEPELLQRMNAYWRAANYVSVGEIYLYDNPLLRERLTLAHVKPLVVSHWGTTPGQNFIYVHLNRVIKAVRHWLAIPTSKAPTARFIPTSARMRPG